MFCPHCGTKSTTSAQRFCRECGGEMNMTDGPAQESAGPAGAQAQGSANGPGAAWGGASSTPRQPFMLAQVTVKDNTMKTLLLIGGLLLLLPLAIPLFFGALLASLFAGFALIGLAFKLAPLLAVALIIYWFAKGRRRAMYPHHQRQ